MKSDGQADGQTTFVEVCEKWTGVGRSGRRGRYGGGGKKKELRRCHNKTL